MKDKNTKTTNAYIGDDEELTRNERIAYEAAILREMGGGDAAGLRMEVGAIEDTDDAVAVFEALRFVLDAVEDDPNEISQGDIAVALVAAAVDYSFGYSLDAAHHALAPFPQTDDPENRNCRCPHCAEEGK